MAVLNSKKFLPEPKEGMLAKVSNKQSFVPKYSLVSVRDLKPESPEPEPRERKITLLNQVVEIKKKTISIEKIVNKNTKLYQKSEEKKRKLLERQKREKREEGLETKKKDDTKEEKELSVPGLGFLDRAKKFLIFTALGGLFEIVQKYIPKILGFLKFAAPIYKFIEDAIKMLVGGFTTFIDKAYQLNDAIRKEVENFGGDEALKKLDSFTKTFTRYANLAIMLFSAGIPSSLPLGPKGKLPGGVPGGKGGGKPGSTQKPKPLSKFQVEQLRKKAPSVKGPGIGPKSGAPKGRIFNRGLGRSLTRAQTKLIGRQNQLMLSRTARTFGNRASALGGRLTLGGKLPIIGPIIMGYDTYMADADGDGEPDKKLDKSLFVAGGSALGGLLASSIPVFGTILGSVVGGYIGDLMYEMILGKGPLAAGQRFKKDVVNALKTSLGFGKHLFDSAKRFFDYLPKIKFIGYKTPIINPVKLVNGDFNLMGALKAALFPETFSYAYGKGKVDKKNLETKVRDKDKDKDEDTFIDRPSVPAGPTLPQGEFWWMKDKTKESFEPILNLIAQYESNGSYESMYPNTILKGATEMTIAEVAKKATGAVGKWQNLPEFLVERAKKVRLNPEIDLYNAENQLKIALYLMGPGQANVTPKMIRKNPDEAMLRISKVWAAVPVPKDVEGAKRFVKRGESYYAGVGDNKAHIDPNQMYAAMGHANITAYAKGGKTKGGSHLIKVGEKGPEYVLDADTTRALEDNYPEFLDRINKADYKGSVDVLKKYTSYHNPTKSILMYQRIFIEKSEPITQSYF